MKHRLLILQGSNSAAWTCSCGKGGTAHTKSEARAQANDHVIAELKASQAIQTTTRK